LEKLNFAIVGCGRIAQRHAEHIAQLGRLTGVCDIKPDRAQALAAKYSCRFYTAIETLLDSSVKCDVVSVCSPNALHATHSIQALHAGKHVLCEKPMAISTQECKRMILAAQQAKKELFIVKQNRFNPPVIALREVIEKGKLGKILSVQLNCFWNRNDQYYLESDWKGRKALDGGTLFTQFSHFIDLLYWLVGDIKKVFAITKNLNHPKTIEFEDTGVIALEFNNGALGTINYTVNSYQKNMEGSLTIFGEKGTIKVGGQYLNVLEYHLIEGYKIDSNMESRPANEYGFYQGSMSNHDKVYENVVEVLLNQGKIATNGTDGMKTVEIIEKIYRQAELARFSPPISKRKPMDQQTPVFTD